MSQLRSKVLIAFKNLHKARLKTFSGDTNALKAARTEINLNFRKNKDVTDPNKIEELIVVANDAANILKKHIIQMEEVNKNHFKVNLTEDIEYIDNTVYQDVPEENLLKKKPTRHNNRNCKSKS